ncbi:type II toxin-antitoxin system VapC family toxin [Luteimonas sp. RD2P54]|uniref:Ribonuclease VapC n=1 Tax=Luteimonas endophytica TaxID=3042023 RepID=A0ABT6J4G3_9GAMM|nr:type II toxin-antitoxin system VapC family toxin [Luteimonas endophytica]MDH5821709.1 type II toxin-antitoxin system VapC family toxin [Luteimonas endophytica]
MYLLDTNVVSELRKVAEGRAAARVAAWQADLDELACFLSVITLQELQVGVLRVERRDAARGALLRAWLEQRVIPEFAGRILPVDQPVALRCAQLHVPDPRPAHDALIAATALVHGLTVVTRNTADFAPMDVALLDPWQEQAG